MYEDKEMGNDTSRHTKPTDQQTKEGRLNPTQLDSHLDHNHHWAQSFRLNGADIVQQRERGIPFVFR
jgi:hypothetical protein